MEQRNNRRRAGQILWGLVFILAAVWYAGYAMDFWSLGLRYRGLWTFFIIIPCLISLVSRGFTVFSMAGLLVGIELLLLYQGTITQQESQNLIFPGILLILGLSFLFQSISRRHGGSGFCEGATRVRMKPSKKALDYAVTFQGQTIRYENEDFYGAILNSIFGGIRLHTENGYISEDIVVDCTSVFGGIKLFLPEGVNVRVRKRLLFGGVHNSRHCCQMIPGAPTVYVNATCMFGGVKIR